MHLNFAVSLVENCRVAGPRQPITRPEETRQPRAARESVRVGKGGNQAATSAAALLHYAFRTSPTAFPIFFFLGWHDARRPSGYIGLRSLQRRATRSVRPTWRTGSEPPAAQARDPAGIPRQRLCHGSTLLSRERRIHHAVLLIHPRLNYPSRPEGRDFWGDKPASNLATEQERREMPPSPPNPRLKLRWARSGQPIGIRVKTPWGTSTIAILPTSSATSALLTEQLLQQLIGDIVLPEVPIGHATSSAPLFPLFPREPAF